MTTLNTFLNVGSILLIETIFLIVLIYIYMKNWSKNEKLMKIIESAHALVQTKKQKTRKNLTQK